MPSLLLTSTWLKVSLKFSTMKTSKIVFLEGKSNTVVTSRKVGTSKSLFFLLLILLLAGITLLSSCFIRVSGHGREGGMNGHHKKHVPSERHGNGRHH